MITSDPSPATICQDAGVTFTATASNGTSFTYQWRKDGSTITGATNSTYSVNSAQTTDSGSYTCVVTNNFGCTRTSDPVSLTVNPKPSIVMTSDPSPATICQDASVTFTATATNGTSFTYQWRKDGSTITGATNSTYSVNSAQTTDSGSYTCVVTNNFGCTRTSDPVSLTVNPKPSIVITSDPSPATICQDASITFTATATSGTSFTYQWRKNGANITGATNSTYSITVAQTTDAGDYDCVVTNNFTCTNTSSAVTLTVNLKPSLVITSNPSPATICQDSSITFTVTATNGASFTYQWRKNGSNITGANDSTYSITGAQTTDSGSFDCVVTNNFTCTNTSSAVTLTVNAKPSLVITSNPSPATICQDSNVTFTVTATNGTSFTYQWRKNGSNITGANDSTYTISIAQTTDSGSYDCVVTNNFTCTNTSGAIVLTVNAKPTITTHPQTQTVCENGSVTFTVAATGSGLTYQWVKAGADISGATDTSYTINPVQLGDAANYWCRVTDSNNCYRDSSPATLTVNPQPSLVISSSPSPATICQDDNITFTVTASGGVAFTYQWRKEGSNISGATNSTYTIMGAQPIDMGSYDCVVTNNFTCSKTSGTVTLTVNPKPSLTGPSNQTLCQDEAISLSVTATNGTTFTYQWRKGGSNITGATDSSYTKTLAQTTDSGSYDCVVTNNYGCVRTSVAATVIVNPKPVITTHPQPQSLCAGSSVTFTVVATTGSPFTYQWLKNGSNISGATNSSYTINPIQSSDTANYSCVVTNTYGCSTTSNQAGLTVLTKPTITTNPLSQAVCENASVTFTVAATGGSPFTYQWRKDGSNLSGATLSSYTINPVLTTSAGTYDCVVTNMYSCSTTSNGAILTVNALPVITTQPESKSVCSGDSTTLTVVASGSSLTYRWQKDGTNLNETPPFSGTQTATLTITNVGQSEAGSYTCIVTATGSCSKTSNAAVLSIVQKPQITSQPSPTSTCSGGNASFTIVVNGGTSYQWYKDGVQLSNGGVYSGVTTTTLQITGATTAQAGNYSCTVTGSGNCSRTSNNAALTVYDLPATPGAPTVTDLDPCSLTGVQVTWSPVSGATSYDLLFNGVTTVTGVTSPYTYHPSDSSAHNYQIRAHNSNCTGTWSPATSGTDATGPLPTITGGTANSCPSMTVALNTESGMTDYQWYKDLSVIPGATTSAYTVTATGSYTVSYSASGCTGTSTAHVVTISACAPPPEVAPGDTYSTSQRWEDSGANPSKEEQRWDPVSDIIGYRLYRGGLADLANLLDANIDSCLRYEGANPYATGLTEDPAALAAGDFYWYIVVAYNGAGNGSAGDATTGARVLNSSGGCP